MAEKKDNKFAGVARYADLLIVGIMFFVCIALGLFMGSYLDKWLNTKPWLTLLFILFGIAAAFINLFRTISRNK